MTTRIQTGNDSGTAVAIRIHFAWWFPFYCRGLLLAAWVMRMLGVDVEPDWAKFGQVTKRAIRLRRVDLCSAAADPPVKEPSCP